MKTVFIFHGTGGSPEGNWFPWLKKELEARGCWVYVPRFPHPENHHLSDWLEVLKKYEKDIVDEDTIFVGHSLGGLFLLRVLELLKKPARAAFFVSTPIGIKPIRYYESDFAFSGFSFNWPEIKRKAEYFAVYHSDNDPYVSLGNGVELAKQLGIKLKFIPKAGHLNAESGYTKFHLLLMDIEKSL